MWSFDDWKRDYQQPLERDVRRYRLAQEVKAAHRNHPAAQTPPPRHLPVGQRAAGVLCRLCVLFQRKNSMETG
jgi:hypothetical protein